MVGENEAGLAEFAHGLHQLVELFARGAAAQKHGGVVRARALRILVEPVAGLGRGHEFVVRREKADRGAAAHAAGEHGVGGVHEDVVGVDRAQACGARGDARIDQLADQFEAAAQRLGAGRASHAGGDGAALGAHQGIIERHQFAGEFGERLLRREIRGEQRAQGIRPTFDGVGYDEHGVAGAGARDGRQSGHMAGLHGKSDAAAAQQQPERFLEESRTVAVGGRAVVNAGMLAQDRVAAKLHGALAAQHHAVFHGLVADIQQVVHIDAAFGKVTAVHVDHTIHRLLECFPAQLFRNIAAVFGRKDIVLQCFDAHGKPLKRNGWRERENLRWQRQPSRALLPPSRPNI